MTLRTQLKNMKMQSSETIQSYFTRVSQLNEQLEAIGDTVEEAELVMTTLNGLPRSWESFIQGICSRRKLTKFSRLWEDCTQEEARMVAREEKLGDDDQALAAHTKKGKSKAHSPGGSKSFKRVKEIIQISNSMVVKRWDILKEIVPITRKNRSKKESIKDIMLMPLKMMNQ
jgi:hypothetical protein